MLIQPSLYVPELCEIPAQTSAEIVRGLEWNEGALEPRGSAACTVVQDHSVNALAIIAVVELSVTNVAYGVKIYVPLVWFIAGREARHPDASRNIDRQDPVAWAPAHRPKLRPKDPANVLGTLERGGVSRSAPGIW